MMQPYVLYVIINKCVMILKMNVHVLFNIYPLIFM